MPPSPSHGQCEQLSADAILRYGVQMRRPDSSVRSLVLSGTTLIETKTIQKNPKTVSNLRVQRLLLSNVDVAILQRHQSRLNFWLCPCQTFPGVPFKLCQQQSLSRSVKNRVWSHFTARCF